INLPTEEMIYLLKNIYEDWKEMKVEIKELAYDIIRNERHILLKTNAITFVVQK
ncbi:class I SAM-dependent methyltransferase, partial [Bacillus cereus group sp. BceL012]